MQRFGEEIESSTTESIPVSVLAIPALVLKLLHNGLR